MWYPSLVPNLGVTIILLPLSMMLALGFCRCFFFFFFHLLGNLSIICVFCFLFFSLVFFSFSFIFLLYFFFYFFDILGYIGWFPNVRPALCTWNKLQLVMDKMFFNISGFDLLMFCWWFLCLSWWNSLVKLSMPGDFFFRF